MMPHPQTFGPKSTGRFCRHPLVIAKGRSSVPLRQTGTPVFPCPLASTRASLLCFVAERSCLRRSAVEIEVGHGPRWPVCRTARPDRTGLAGVRAVGLAHRQCRLLWPVVVAPQPPPPDPLHPHSPSYRKVGLRAGHLSGQLISLAAHGRERRNLLLLGGLTHHWHLCRLSSVLRHVPCFCLPHVQCSVQVLCKMVWCAPLLPHVPGAPGAADCRQHGPPLHRSVVG